MINRTLVSMMLVIAAGCGGGGGDSGSVSQPTIDKWRPSVESNLDNVEQVKSAIDSAFSAFLYYQKISDSLLSQIPEEDLVFQKKQGKTSCSSGGETVTTTTLDGYDRLFNINHKSCDGGDALVDGVGIIDVDADPYSYGYMSGSYSLDISISSKSNALEGEYIKTRLLKYSPGVYGSDKLTIDATVAVEHGAEKQSTGGSVIVSTPDGIEFDARTFAATPPVSGVLVIQNTAGTKWYASANGSGFDIYDADQMYVDSLSWYSIVD